MPRPIRPSLESTEPPPSCRPFVCRKAAALSGGRLKVCCGSAWHYSRRPSVPGRAHGSTKRVEQRLVAGIHPNHCCLGCMAGSGSGIPPSCINSCTKRTLTLSNRGSFTPATLSWLARTLTDACSRRRWANYGCASCGTWRWCTQLGGQQIRRRTGPPSRPPIQQATPTACLATNAGPPMQQALITDTASTTNGLPGPPSQTRCA